MARIKINNIEYTAPEGLTILDVVKGAGLYIPTLCHKEGLPHYSSCMVCMVKDNKSNSFIPSCSALIQDDMDIDISGDDVISLRHKAIELLLSEHRAECEAPCKIVCPAGYNIPLMNRLIAGNDFEAASQHSLAMVNSAEIMCLHCPGYCENACRRKKVDIPVSIRNIQLFISRGISTENQAYNAADELLSRQTPSESGSEKGRLVKRFSSRIGKLEDNELKEWLKECMVESNRFTEISDVNSASSEAKSCMHCDCRAKEDCRLRDLAEEFSIKDPRGKFVNSPIVKKINHNNGLIFENAKCIKCGLCVRLCEDLEEEPGLCFINRGFTSIISEPVTEEFDNILKTKSKEVIEICPTGALSKLKD
jgi:predicted molibdopterin-dependent oxidoreductase YjgC